VDGGGKGKEFREILGERVWSQGETINVFLIYIKLCFLALFVLLGQKNAQTTHLSLFLALFFGVFRDFCFYLDIILGDFFLPNKVLDEREGEGSPFCLPPPP
jgi:hypothetical protein